MPAYAQEIIHHADGVDGSRCPECPVVAQMLKTWRQMVGMGTSETRKDEAAGGYDHADASVPVYNKRAK